MTKEQAFDLVFHVHEDGGVKSTITDFTIGVKNETFTDEKGTGYLVIDIDSTLYESHEIINCNVAYLDQRQREGWTHICWHAINEEGMN